MLGTGTVVLLNGATSSGKSALAAALQDRWPTPAFRLAVDDVGAMRAVRQTWALPADEQPEVLRRTRAGFHRAAAGLASAGNDLIMDHVLSEPWRLDDCLGVFADLRVIFVGVYCDLAELERRERERGDRTVGTAARQVQLVHDHGDYDVTVDTTTASPDRCAESIMDALPTIGPPLAFERLRAARAVAADR